MFFLASLYILSPAKQPNASSDSDQKTTRHIVNELYPLVDEEELQRSVERAVFGFMTYDATSVTALQQFNPVQENTECIFAKKAKLWGNQDWNQELSLGNLSHTNTLFTSNIKPHFGFYSSIPYVSDKTYWNLEISCNILFF